MKKLSVLIALALCLTIGGAYATWTYLTGDVVAKSEDMSIAMGEKVPVDSPYGKFEIVSIPTYIVEPDGATTRVTTLVETTDVNSNSTSPDFVVTFTPDPGAQDTVKANAIPTSLLITIESGNEFGKYNDPNNDQDSDQDIISISTASVELDWVKGADGVFTATVKAADLLKCLSLSKITLGTTDAYDTYAAALASGTITLTVDAQ